MTELGPGTYVDQTWEAPPEEETGPPETQRTGLTIENGIYWFRQSWFGTLMRCPESARRELLPHVKEYDGTDATALGTAAHLGIETFLLGESWQGSKAVAAEWLADQCQRRTFKYVQIKTSTTLMKHLEMLLEGWKNDVYPQIGPAWSIEGSFRHQLSPTIGIIGTTDYEETETVWDWKTAGGQWQQKYSQNAVDRLHQPTFYTAQKTGWTLGDTGTPDAVFKFGGMVKGQTEGFTRRTIRTEGHWEWMYKQLETAVRMFETVGVDEPWLMVDDDWHCSPKWCDHWGACKGSLVTIR